MSSGGGLVARNVELILIKVVHCILSFDRFVRYIPRTPSSYRKCTKESFYKLVLFSSWKFNCNS